MNMQQELAYFKAKSKISFEVEPTHYILPEWKEENGLQIAMDAQPTLVSTANAGIPALLTTFIDPDMLRILQSPNEAAVIYGEQAKGDWTSNQLLFPVLENTGTTAAYDDWSEAGNADVNSSWEPREPFLFQTIIEYGDLEVDRAALAKIGLVSEKQQAAAKAIERYKNKTYFYGVAGLANYGMLNDPSLLPAIAPALKAYGGTKWVVNGNVLATANEIYADIQSVIIQVIRQAGGLLNVKSKFKLGMSPQSEAALTATNQYGINVTDLLKKNYPGLTVHTAVQFGVVSAANPEGQTAGELMQIVATDVEGQTTGYCITNCTLRMGRVIPALSSMKQKALAGSVGGLVRIPYAFAEMVGL